MNTKKRILKAALFITLILTLTAGPLVCQTQNPIVLRTAVNAMPGIFYNGAWDPAYNGTAVSVMGLYEKDTAVGGTVFGAVFGAGIECGGSYTGFNLLFPLRAGLMAAQWNQNRLYISLDIMPGMILTRPQPFFLFASEISAEFVHKITARFNLAYSAGVRYTASPDYSSYISPLETIDLNISIALR